MSQIVSKEQGPGEVLATREPSRVIAFPEKKDASTTTTASSKQHSIDITTITAITAIQMARALSLSKWDFMPSTYGIEKDSVPKRLPQLAIFCEDFFEHARTSFIEPSLLNRMVVLLRILHHNSCMPLESMIPALKKLR
ncbi:hypothetical protein MMC30_002327 [Trapelia coarctata]|nr:hypothetical protein [Trapelia coarctata]